MTGFPIAFLKKFILCSTGTLCFLNSLSSEVLLEQVFKVPKDSFGVAFAVISESLFGCECPLKYNKKIVSWQGFSCGLPIFSRIFGDVLDKALKYKEIGSNYFLCYIQRSAGSMAE